MVSCLSAQISACRHRHSHPVPCYSPTMPQTSSQTTVASVTSFKLFTVFIPAASYIILNWSVMLMTHYLLTCYPTLFNHFYKKCTVPAYCRRSNSLSKFVIEQTDDLMTMITSTKEVVLPSVCLFLCLFVC